MIYSKLTPLVKDSISKKYESELLSYINLTKPYHTKLKDIVVNFTFVENIIAVVSEIGKPSGGTGNIPTVQLSINLLDNIDAYVGDNIISTIGFILDYNKREYVDDYGKPLQLTEKYKNVNYGLGVLPLGADHLGASLDHANISDGYDMLHPTLEYNQNNNDTTIKASIIEKLVIDTSRSVVLGFGTKPYDTDKFDTIDISNIVLPPLKPSQHSMLCGDETFVWGGLDTDIFHKFFTDLDINTIELPRTLPPFDTDIFEKMFKN